MVILSLIETEWREPEHGSRHRVYEKRLAAAAFFLGGFLLGRFFRRCLFGGLLLGCFLFGCFLLRSLFGRRFFRSRFFGSCFLRGNLLGGGLFRGRSTATTAAERRYGLGFRGRLGYTLVFLDGGWFFLLFFLFVKILFQRFAKGAAFTKFIGFIVPTVQSRIIERHISSCIFSAH